MLKTFDINQTISFITDFIFNPTSIGWVFVIKIILILVSLFLFGFIIFVLVKTTWLKRLVIWDLQEFFTRRPFGVLKIGKGWEGIEVRLETQMESEWKLALIEADKMLDDTLNRMGFGGQSLGERLERLTIATLPNLEEIKIAHKVRNNIIHDPTYKLILEEAKKIILIYKKALTDLEAL